MPSASGWASIAVRSIIASSNPGRCQGTQISFRPKRWLNSSSFARPLALAASAMAQSGCRWSTWSNGRKAWSGVSMDGATPWLATLKRG